jgi:serine/threonine protein kinase
MGSKYSEIFIVENEVPECDAKIVKKINIGKDKENVKSIEAEFTIGYKLGSKCPYLVKATEFNMDDNYCYLVMEYCEGGDLRDLLKKKKKIYYKCLIFFFYLIYIFFFFI